MFDFHAKKILSALIYIEMHKCDIDVSSLAQEVLMPEKHVMKIITGDVGFFTVRTLFELLQKLYHNLDISGLVTNKLYLDLDDYDDLKYALVDFFQQERYQVRETEEEELEI